MIGQRRTRRGVAAILSLGLAVAGLTACSSGGSSSGSGGAGDNEKASLTMAIHGSKTDLDVYKERLALAKKKYPNIDVKVNLIPGDFDTKIQTLFAGGKSPDLIELAQEINVYSSKGQLVDLTPYYKTAGIDPVKQSGKRMVDMLSTDGKLWGAPDRAGSQVVFYNKALFDDAGVSYPTAKWDWKDFRDAAIKLTKRDGDKTTQWGYAAGDWWAWYLTWMKQNGGEIIDSKGKPVVDSKANIEAMSFYNDLVLKDRVAPSPKDYANLGNVGPDALFAQGKLAMDTTGFWNVQAMQTSKVKWDIAPMWHGKKQAAAAFGDGIAVSRASKSSDAAAKIAVFLSTAEGQKPIATSGEDVPAHLEVASSKAFTNPTWVKSPVNLKAFAESEQFAYNPPVIPEWNAIQTAFTNGLANVYTGKVTVPSGMADVQSKVKTVLATGN